MYAIFIFFCRFFAKVINNSQLSIVNSQLFCIFVIVKYEVTIGIPVYNVKDHIRATMDSALAQTFESIEFLVLDDCGTDGSIAIVRDYQLTHPRGKDIRVVSQDFNKGIGAARNRILKEAQGRYLFFLDADDLIIDSAVAALVETAKRYEAEVVMASYERIELFHDEPKTIPYQFPEMYFSSNEDFARYAFRQYGALQANIWNVLMDMNFIRSCHIQFVNTNFWEDMAFKYELATYASRVVLSPLITYSYCCRVNTLSNFQVRDEIKKEEILHNVATIDTLKYSCRRLRDKSYFSAWLTFVLDTDFYIICEILRQRKVIQPKVSDVEIRNFLHSPLSIKETLLRTNPKCWSYKLLSLVPAKICVWVIYLLGKTRNLT